MSFCIRELKKVDVTHLKTRTSFIASSPFDGENYCFALIVSHQLSTTHDSEINLILPYRGDYRTGKRLNMRKVIPYIASQFRKDKIWLRRTKPSKRQYQVMVAVDDSSSMADNHSKQVSLIVRGDYLIASS